jgi:hypothetical protein
MIDGAKITGCVGRDPTKVAGETPSLFKVFKTDCGSVVRQD